MAGFDSRWMTSFGLGVVDTLKSVVAGTALSMFGMADSLLSKDQVKEILSFRFWKAFPYKVKYIGDGHMVEWVSSSDLLGVRVIDHEGKEDSVWDLPAVIAYDRATGRPVKQEWFRHGGRHRENGPAIIKAYTPGNTRVVYYKNGKKEGNTHSMAETAAPAA